MWLKEMMEPGTFLYFLDSKFVRKGQDKESTH